MMTNRIRFISGFLAIVFMAFAAMQYNDPDGWKWIIAYLVPCVLFGLLVGDRHYAKAGKMLLIIFIFTALIYIPDLIKWMSTGFPSIVETMQAEKPSVELMREFFGLVIIILSLVYYRMLKSTD